MNPKRPQRTIKLSTLFIISMLVITLISSVIILRWAYQPSNILTINNSPVPVQPPKVDVGGKVFLTIDFCKRGDYAEKTDVKLIGKQGAKIDIAWTSGRTTEQCTKLVNIPLLIPGQTPSDIYYAEFTVCYDINPLKKNRCTTFKTKEFKVVNEKLNPGDAKVKM